MKIFVFGSSITSTYWNGAATYYRGIYKSLHALGCQVTFAEPDIYGRQQKRDVGTVDYAEVCVYQTPRDLPALLKDASHADIIIKHSGVGAEDERLEREVLTCRSNNSRVIFWDVDAPATLSRVKADPSDPFRRLIPEYDGILTYGGGPAIVRDYVQFGARTCVPVYNALDPETHYAAPPNAKLRCDLAFLGNRLPDRESRVAEFFLRTARLAPEMSFILGGEGWGDKPLPRNVRWIGHAGSDLHNAINCSARMVLNINRNSMARVGFSPPTRIFEAAGAGACTISDRWEGIDTFFLPGIEILTAGSAEEVAAHLRRVSSLAAKKMGAAMLRRALREHTYPLRAGQALTIFHRLFGGGNKQAAGVEGRMAVGGPTGATP